MRRLFLGFLFTLLIATQALAQGSVLQGGSWSPGRAPMYVGSGSGQAIVQDSGPAGGGAAGLGLKEQLLVARGTGTPPYVGQGTGPLGTNWCSYDAPTTNAAGYHYLCLSPNATGNAGLLTFGSGGVASPIPFYFLINGIQYAFPSVGACPLATAFVSGCVQGDGATLIIAPITGVIAIDLTHANTWTGIQTFKQSFKVAGSSSGSATIAAQAAAGAPTLTLPTTTGTFPSTATAPLILNAVTGVLSCPTCTVPGGSSGQIEYNNSGAFGGFTASGDAAINTSTGVVTIQPGVVTNAKIAPGAANTFKGSLNGSATSDIALTACTLTYQITKWVSGTGWQCGIQPIIPSAAILQTLNLSAFTTVWTQGYTTAGDGGDAQYTKIGTNAYCAQTDLSGQIWYLNSKKPVNAMSCGALFDHSTNDSTAIQAAIHWAENIPNSAAGEPHGTVVCPSGETSILGTTLSFTNPITFDCPSAFYFTGGGSTPAFDVGKVAGTGNGQNWDIRIRSLTCSGTAGQIGVRLYYINFSIFSINQIQNCSGIAGFYCDGTGGTRTPQIIQHNTFNLGQIVNNSGIGILLDSLNAATSSCEGNVWNIQNSYQNGTSVRVDQSGHTASSSNTFNIQSMDNASSGTVLEINGVFNTFNVGFYEQQIVIQASGANNTFILGNKPPAATVSNLGGATNKCWVAGSVPATC